MKITALIMAGGRGERFWPKSRKSLPKQFLSLTNNGITMIQHTVNRILPIIDPNDIYISTNQEYVDIVLEQLPNIPRENILLEPIAKNTAPCIAMAAMYINNKYQDAIMAVLPSDHLIKNKEMFIYTLKDACRVSESNSNLVTIGITPTQPETGYGYIKFDNKRESFGNSNAFKVECFVEKPSISKAKEYLTSGNYLWNSGIFVWKISSILKRFEQLLPNIYNPVKEIISSINTESYNQILLEKFQNFDPISIDYGIMEKAKDIFVIPGAFDWDDVGSWLALERINNTDDFNNVVSGNVITIDSKNSIIQGNDKLIATVGINGLIIVDTNDALLICNKNEVGSIKKVLENLKICNRKEYI